MSYRQHLLDCIKTEIETCKYLYSKIAPEKLGFRPKEGLRSIEELLRYLSWCGVESVASFFLEKAETTGGNYIYYAHYGDSLLIEQFPEAMDRQMEEIARLFTHVTEEDLLTRMIVYPWRAKAPLGEAIMETSVKWLASYKMQLFITMKMAGGNDELNTLDCWIRPYMHIRQRSDEVGIP